MSADTLWAGNRLIAAIRKMIQWISVSARLLLFVLVELYGGQFNSHDHRSQK